MSSSTVLFAQHNRINRHELLPWMLESNDGKFHKSSRYTGNKALWRTWKGGHRLRGYTHQVFNKNFHQRYNSPAVVRNIQRTSWEKTSSNTHYSIFRLREKLHTSFS